MYVTGASRTTFGKLQLSLAELVYDVIYGAVRDAELSIADVDCFFVSNFLSGPLNAQLHLNSVVTSMLPTVHVPTIGIETACASAGVAFNRALSSLHEFDDVMVIGVEKMTSPNLLGQMQSLAMASDYSLDRRNGIIFPANYALIAQQYMRKYDVGHDVLEDVSFINHAHANLNPLAHFYRKRVTKEVIARAPIVATPLNLFDCSPVSDGAVALLLSKERRSDRDVRVACSQLASDSISLTQRRDLTSFAAVKLAAKSAYAKAELAPRDVDLWEVHDCFTISELLALDDLGLCAPGGAAQLITEGEVSREGNYPVNVDGGLIGNGHPVGATGLAQIYEIVTQIRCEAGLRQLEDVEVGLAHNIGGIGGTAAITILGEH